MLEHRPFVHSTLGVIVMLVFLSSATNALANTIQSGLEITVESANRSVSTWAEYFDDPPRSESEYNRELGAWSPSVRSYDTKAAQQSVIAANELAGLLSIDIGPSDFREARSELTTTFTVPAAGPYAIEGTFAGTAEVMYILLREIGVGGSTIVTISGFTGAFREALVLEPGARYELSASLLSATFNGKSSIEFAFVPEPSTALLVGLGLGALTVRWRAGRLRPGA